jgi:hypothetical protein
MELARTTILSADHHGEAALLGERDRTKVDLVGPTVARKGNRVRKPIRRYRTVDRNGIEVHRAIVSHGVEDLIVTSVRAPLQGHGKARCAIALISSFGGPRLSACVLGAGDRYEKRQRSDDERCKSHARQYLSKRQQARVIGHAGHGPRRAVPLM